MIFDRPARLAIAAFGLIVPFAVFGLKTASMKLPSELSETVVRLRVEGYGGANRGRFHVAGFSGDFTRIESRLAVFDPLYASNRGKASFTMTGPDLDGSVEADCSFKQNVATVGIVTFDPKKFAFVCDIAGTGSFPGGRLTLGEPRPEGMKQRLLARAMRRGLARIDSIDIAIESVHEYSGSRIQAQTPVGYLLSVDSRVTGALELTDVNPTIFLASDLSERDRSAVLIAAIAVSLLRDPASSTLGD